MGTRPRPHQATAASAGGAWEARTGPRPTQMRSDTPATARLRATTQEYLEGKHLKFKAHIRGWEASFRERLCQSLLVKTESNLWKVLLIAPWRDILLVPHAWYPDHKPKFETPGWWYAPAEAVLGRTCKSCNAFCELADFTSTKGKRTVSEICLRCHCLRMIGQVPTGDVGQRKMPRGKEQHQCPTVASSDVQRGFETKNM